MKNIEESYFKSHDQHRLFYTYIKTRNPKGILLFVHGMNEHSGRYQNPVSHFQNDYDLYLFDQRGFGKSDGIRSHVDRFDDYCRDLDEFVRFIHLRHKKSEIYLIGHSMGGQVVINYAAQYPEAPISGIMLSSPNIKVAMKIHPVKKWAGKKLSRFAPKAKISCDLDPSRISRDRAVVEAYKKDPMVRDDITCRLASEILRNQESILALAERITKPVFLMHGGDDKICDPQGSKDFFARLKIKTKKLKIYEGMYHEIFNEFGHQQVFQDMAAWLQKMHG